MQTKPVLRSLFSAILVSLGLSALTVLSGCAGSRMSRHSHRPLETVVLQEGTASWYGPGFHGRKTASGERFNQKDMTCAHRTLPFGTYLKVVNLENDQSVVVRVNDRGPFKKGRIVDLSKGAAKEIDLISTGIAPVRLEKVVDGI